jgi:hypothetical protein
MKKMFLNTYITMRFGWFYLLMIFAFVGFVLTVPACSKYNKIVTISGVVKTTYMNGDIDTLKITRQFDYYESNGKPNFTLSGKEGSSCLITYYGNSFYSYYTEVCGVRKIEVLSEKIRTDNL